MSTIDLIALERQRYLSSGQTKRDWFRYVTTVERLRREREETGLRSEAGATA